MLGSNAMNYGKKRKTERTLLMFRKFLKEHNAQIVIITFALLLIVVAYVYYKQYFYVMRDPRRLKELIMGYGQYGVLVLIGIQIVQVIVFFIPGGFVQVAGGYIYGTLVATLISIMGTVVGSFIVFIIAKRFGKPFITRIVSEKDMKFFQRLLHVGREENSIHNGKKRSLAVIFLLYFIPGIPKDVLGYICGITDISLKDFILYSTIARIPGILISSYFGAKMVTENRLALIIIGLSMSAIFILGMFKGEKIIRAITKR
jgi:uncharacterized membrane protein YdjX (TVP38/TMEM64 family)